MNYGLPKRIEQKLYLWSLLYFAAILPFQFQVLSPTIGILGVSVAWFFSFRFKEKFALFIKSPAALTAVALVIIECLGLIYTTNHKEGEKDVVMKMSIFVFPLIFSGIAHWPQNWTRKTLLTLAFSTALSSLYLLLNSCLFYIENNTWLLHQDFVKYPRIGVHYFALYNILSFFSLLYFFPKGRWLKWLYTICLLVFVTSLMFAAARVQLLIFGLGLIYYFFWRFRDKPFLKVLLAQISAILILFLITLLIPFTRQRITDSYHELKAYEGNDKTYQRFQTNHRVFIWSYGVQVVKEHIPFGTGTGAENDYLYEKLKTEDAEFWDGTGTYTLSKHKYNYHNEYLQHLAALGLPGILALLAVLITPFFSCRLNFISILFLGMILLSFITESILQRQAGTLFFAFFYALFFCIKNPILLENKTGHKNITLQKF